MLQNVYLYLTQITFWGYGSTLQVNGSHNSDRFITVFLYQ
jgi:hypothetical protein